MRQSAAKPIYRNVQRLSRKGVGFKRTRNGRRLVRAYDIVPTTYVSKCSESGASLATLLEDIRVVKVLLA